MNEHCIRRSMLPVHTMYDILFQGSLTSATALPSMTNNETLVRNMHSHTALTTADRYNGAAPSLQSSKSAGNLSSNPSAQVIITI